MVDRYIFQLKSLTPDLRRQAIEQLATATDERAIPPLLDIARHDPVEELRDLADAAIDQIQRNIKDEEDRNAADPLARYLPKNINTTDADRQRAQRHILQAYNYRDGKRNDVALYELAEAIQLNPMLVYERPITTLAADLLQSGESSQQAMLVLLQRIADNEIKAPQREFMDEAGKQYFVRSLVAVALLYLLILAICMGMTRQPLSLNLFATSLLPALFGLVSVVIADLFMFVIVTLFNANTTINQFMSTVLGSQVPIFAIAFVLTVILPIIQITPIVAENGTVTVMVHTNLFLPFVVAGVYINYQTFFIWRISKFTADKGLVAAIMGLTVAVIVATIFGLLKNVNIG